MLGSISRRASVCALAACAVTISANQALASAPHKVKITDCTSALTRPKTVVLTCGDGTIALERLSWSSFGGARARASGQISVNDCEPNCASSRAKSYPVKIVASKPKACRRSVSVYGSLAITFTGARPPSASSLKHATLACPA